MGKEGYDLTSEEIFVSRDVQFFESSFPYLSSSTPSHTSSAHNGLSSPNGLFRPLSDDPTHSNSSPPQPLPNSSTPNSPAIGPNP